VKTDVVESVFVVMRYGVLGTPSADIGVNTTAYDGENVD
jgi:hypothetical protein